MAAFGLGAIRLPGSSIDGQGSDDPALQQYSTREVDLGEPETPDIDPDTATKVELDGGSVVIYIGKAAKKARSDAKFDDNLAEDLEPTVRGQICDNLLRLIDEDDNSRSEWSSTRAKGIELLGFKIESMRASGIDGSAPLEGMSQMRSTLLSEAVVRWAANALAELLPADGPAKVKEVTTMATSDTDDNADALEVDLNNYLLNVDKPYVDDFDAALPRIAVDGSVFKKVYHDPILGRPISRVVYGEDLIVNNSATSIYSATRITHRVFMPRSTLIRMQIIGAYLDEALGEAGWADPSPQEEQVEEISGIKKGGSSEPDDRPYELLECYCELDIPGFEHKMDGKITGLPIPYKVVINKESRHILEIRRNYEKVDELCLPKAWFVHYCFMRGFGFYGIGLSHLLGNTTLGVTAAQREFIDACMFANFPGGLIQKGASRQNNNNLRAGPGAFVDIETGGLPINQVAMPFPYKPPDAVSVGFIQSLEAAGKSLGGTADLMVGEGRQDAPVGTTLALIEQAIKPQMATHKRMCRSLGDELQMLVERFREDPGSFVRSINKLGGALTWEDEMFEKAIKSRAIVPRADPNTASHMQRMLRNAALYQMAKDEPGAFNVLRIRQMCIRGIGFADPNQFLNQNPQPPAPDPKAQAALLGAQADLMDGQTNARKQAWEEQHAGIQADLDQQEQQSKMQIAQIQLKREMAIQQGEAARAQREQGKAQTDMAKGQMDNQLKAQEVHQAGVKGQQEAMEGERDRQHDLQMQQQDHMHEMQMAGMQHQQAMQQGAMDQAGQAQQADMQHQHALEEGHQQQQGQVEQAGVQHKHALEQTKVQAKLAPKPAAGGNKPAKKTPKRADGGAVIDLPNPFRRS